MIPDDQKTFIKQIASLLTVIVLTLSIKPRMIPDEHRKLMKQVTSLLIVFMLTVVIAFESATRIVVANKACHTNTTLSIVEKILNNTDLIETLK